MNSVDLGRVKASLAGAPDLQISRVVAMVDAMPERGAADSLIAALRPRLAQLRPARRVGFARLLFTPLNPVIMSTAEWRRSGLGVPRPALATLGKAVRAALPAASSWHGDGQVLPDSGPALWPIAAAILDRLTMPPAWSSSTGLSPAEYQPVTSIVTGVLQEAAAIELLAQQPGRADDAALRNILSNGQGGAAGALDTLVAVLLDRLELPVRILAIAADVAGSDHVVGRALDRLVEKLAQHSGEDGNLRATAYEAGRIAVLLSSLESAAIPGRRERLDQARRKADTSCRRCFENAFAQTVALLKTDGIEPPDNQTIATMEVRARDLRWLETAARKLGNAKFYDTLLSDAVVSVRSDRGRLAFTDQIRLVEILDGREQALAMLTGARPVSAKR